MSLSTSVITAPGGVQKQQDTMLSLATDEHVAQKTQEDSAATDDFPDVGKLAGLDPPSHPDHAWWWARTAPLLATLLRSAGSYTPQQQTEHMRVYRDAVVPTYGAPTPRAGGLRPLLTMDGSPFEPSWNFQNDGTVIRYSFEPLLPNDDPQANPFPGDKVASLLPLLRYVAAGADTRWFEQVWAQWFVSDADEVARAKAALPPHKPRVPQIFLAFDMKGADRVMKVYLFPILKHLATGRSTEELTWAAIRGLKPGGERFDRPVARLSRFLAQRADHPDADERMPVEMIAIDCIDPARARIKVYARSRSNSLATVRDACTLGGAQTDEATMAGVEHLSRIWHLLLDEPAGLQDENRSKPPRYPRDHHLGVCFVFELRPDQDRVEVKAHLPWAQTNSKDIRTIANFTDALELLGYDDHAARYARGALATANL